MCWLKITIPLAAFTPIYGVDIQGPIEYIEFEYSLFFTPTLGVSSQTLILLELSL